MKVGIKDVAAAAGVSITTVSHTLNHTEGKRVSPETRRRVQRVAEELGYTPNHVGRSLRLQRTQTVALMGHRIATTPFVGDLIRGAQAGAREHGAALFVLDASGDPAEVEREATLLVQRQVDGVLFAAWFHQEVQVPRALQPASTVLVDAVCSDKAYSSVVPDEQAGGRAAATELIAAGHRRVAFVNGEPDVLAARGRERGFRAECRAAGLTDVVVVNTVSSTRGGYATGLTLLATQRPTGVFCYNDRVAMGVYQAAAELRLRIPDDLSVVGFDNQELIADALRPALTSVALPHHAMGHWAVRQLYAQLNEPVTGSAVVQAVLQGPVVRRSSVAPPPSGSTAASGVKG